MYWLELIAESGIKKDDELRRPWKEGDEILAIIVKSIKGSRNNQWRDTSMARP